MAFISNQWLNRGLGFRTRAYLPVEVTLSATNADRDDDFCREHDIAVEITAVNSLRQYQQLFLGRRDAEVIAGAIVDNCGATTRKRLAETALMSLSNRQLVAVLVRALQNRGNF